MINEYKNDIIVKRKDDKHGNLFKSTKYTISKYGQ